MNATLVLPEGLSVLDTQVAGHTFSANSNALGMLKDTSMGYVLKPLGKPECGKRELCFYESLQNTRDLELLKMLPFVPVFHGTIQLKINGSDYSFLKLEDLTYGMRKPCIMDIKVGKRTWDPLSSPQKRLIEEQKYSACKQKLGLCLPGFQMYSKDAKSGKEVLLRYGREYGKQLDEKGFRKTIGLFLYCHDATSAIISWPLRHELLKQLYVIDNWFKKQRVLHFYASSLLIVYDYDALNELQETMLKTSTNSSLHNYGDLSHLMKIRMIDFAHVFPTKSVDSISSVMPDSNYIFGLRNFIHIIEDSLYNDPLINIARSLNL